MYYLSRLPGWEFLVRGILPPLTQPLSHLLLVVRVLFNEYAAQLGKSWASSQGNFGGDLFVSSYPRGSLSAPLTMRQMYQEGQPSSAEAGGRVKE